MTLYRLYLGGKRGDTVIPDFAVERFITRVVGRVLNGYTRYKTRGVWLGSSEPVEVIEYLGEDTEGARKTVRAIAEQYAAEFGQDSVLLTMARVDAEFISAPIPAEIAA